MLKFLLFCGLMSCLIPSSLKGQERYFVQFVFQGEFEINAQEVDSTLRSFDAVYMSRTDLNTSNYLAVCGDESAFDIVEDYFLDLGFSVSCQHTGIHGQERIGPLDPRKCGFQEIGEEEK